VTFVRFLWSEGGVFAPGQLQRECGRMRTRAAELLHLHQEIVAPALSALILNQADPSRFFFVAPCREKLVPCEELTHCFVRCSDFRNRTAGVEASMARIVWPWRPQHTPVNPLHFVMAVPVQLYCAGSTSFTPGLVLSDHGDSRSRILQSCRTFTVV
jgi:hypothetical protein